jgi:hypothetical protein
MEEHEQKEGEQLMGEEHGSNVGGDLGLGLVVGWLGLCHSNPFLSVFLLMYYTSITLPQKKKPHRRASK